MYAAYCRTVGLKQYTVFNNRSFINGCQFEWCRAGAESLDEYKAGVASVGIMALLVQDRKPSHSTTGDYFQVNI